MTEKLESGTQQLQLCNNKTATLKYYIVINQIATEQNGEIFTYGAEIELHTRDEHGNEVCETARCQDISICKDNVLTLLDLLKACTVTPVNLLEVVEDYLAALDHPLPVRA